MTQQGFPPFKAAQPKGAEPEMTTEQAEEHVAEGRFTERVRICAKCHSTEVVEAVRIGDALYVKVSQL